MKIFRVHTKDSENRLQNVCCICGEKYEGYGNNPAPIKDYGKCCDKCNIEKVIPARIKALKKDSFDWLDALINSEKLAIDEYTEAIEATNDEERVAVYLHILAEEKEHLEELGALRK